MNGLGEKIENKENALVPCRDPSLVIVASFSIWNSHFCCFRDSRDSRNLLIPAIKRRISDEVYRNPRLPEI
ncbi:hypothetical protein MRB53_021626 [Persea americana]|uniref:Uncharacterized protein n=2 Tax=Persea americana TaxID=3435 RepID=A0ACC2L4C5_PERAE|nr:hypothetical protein MRB53_021487 [Persea americana]KAJ8628319.1 hypothetical protein MRB53_021626 [Persea americana]